MLLRASGDRDRYLRTGQRWLKLLDENMTGDDRRRIHHSLTTVFDAPDPAPALSGLAATLAALGHRASVYRVKMHRDQIQAA